MDTEIKVRQQVSFSQIKGLIHFLKDHPELAKGLSRGRRGELNSLRLWNLCAQKLNIYKEGAKKDGKGWSKYWCDWKYRVKRRALELKAARDSNKPPPDGNTPLSVMEESIISIIGEGSLDNIIVKGESLSEDSDECAPDNNEHIQKRVCHAKPSEPERRSGGRKRRQSSSEALDVEDDGGPSSSCEHHRQKAKSKSQSKDESDDKDTAEFLRIEKEKLVNAKKLHATIHTLTGEVTRLANIMEDIKDALINKSLNIQD